MKLLQPLSKDVRRHASVKLKCLSVKANPSTRRMPSTPPVQKASFYVRKPYFYSFCAALTRFVLAVKVIEILYFSCIYGIDRTRNCRKMFCFFLTRNFQLYGQAFPKKTGIVYSCPRVLAVKAACQGVCLGRVCQRVEVLSPNIFAPASRPYVILFQVMLRIFTEASRYLVSNTIT